MTRENEREFNDYLIKLNQKLTTRTGNINHAKNYISWLESQEIKEIVNTSYKDLLAYVKFSKDQGSKKRSINVKLIALKHYYNYLIELNKIDINPVEELTLKNITKQQPQNILTWKQLENIYLNYKNSSITGRRNKAIIGMFIYQGLSSNEISSLEIKDIKLEEAKVEVFGTDKTNSRTLKLQANQILELQKYLVQIRPILLELSPKQTDKLFISTGEGNKLSNTFTNLTKQIKKIEPKYISPKQIRTSVITYWLKIYKLREVQYMIGHKYVSSTERYQTKHLDELQDQIDQMHPLNTPS